MDTNMIMTLAIAVAAFFLVSQLLGNRKAPRAVVQEKLANGAVVVDVRSKGEFASGAYPKAKNIPLDALPARLAELPRDKPLVLYCASGSRAGQAARILKGAGFADVVNAGGIGDLR
jgi:rhodanese-related sulfurtransferase